MHHPPIKQIILVANRGEIALRIFASCAARGHEAIAVYAPEDASSPHVYRANRAFQLSGSGSAAYINQEELITIALQAGATAVHPGYGFLAENAQFARAVCAAGLVWIGPRPELIALMGDKQAAREAMEQANVPIAPGTYVDGAEQVSLDAALHAATSIGYPVIIKSALGGGGKAMRTVPDAAMLRATWNTVLSESVKFFSSTLLIIEKYVTRGRHIEVQCAGDGTHAIHLFERECSVQRRHQKVIEEAPCRFISDAVKQRLFDATLRATRSIAYDNIGTLEFLVTPDEQIYFLEMNTRLQVEHSVTEMTTGIDLVGLQLTLAFDKTLPLQQEQIVQRGHAIECRIYSEDPEQNFCPSSGALHTLELPTYPTLRIDHALLPGMRITPLFDPMIAKLTSYGANRTHALGSMLAALRTTHMNGVQTNIVFLQELLRTDDFATGSIDTQWLERYYAQRPTHESKEPPLMHIAAAALSEDASKQASDTVQETSLLAARSADHTLDTSPDTQRGRLSSAWRAQRWH